MALTEDPFERKKKNSEIVNCTSEGTGESRKMTVNFFLWSLKTYPFSRALRPCKPSFANSFSSDNLPNQRGNHRKDSTFTDCTRQKSLFNVANWQVYRLKWREVTFKVLWATKTKCFIQTEYSGLHSTPTSYQYSDNYSSVKTDTSKTNQTPTIRNTYSRRLSESCQFDQMALLECNFILHENDYTKNTLDWINALELNLTKTSYLTKF